MSWPKINPGELRHYGEIRQRSTALDDFGQQSDTWTAVGAVWYGLDLVSMKEALGSNQITEQTTHTVTMRWPGFTVAPGMRLYDGNSGSMYRIQAVNDVERRHVLVHLLVLELNESVGA